MRLKNKLKSKYFKKSISTIKERTDVSKINKYVKDIYNENVLKKTFRALKERDGQLR